MKTINGVIVGAVIVVGVILGVLWYQNNQKPEKSGTLYIGITDATADIENVNDISLSVKKVEVYSATQGWVSVSSADKSYELLALNASGKTELYAKADVAADTYNKVRVTLGDAIVKTKSKGSVKATLPSSYVVVSTAVKVRENATTSLKLDILADQSLHTTSDEGYLFAPVVKTESRSNVEVAINSNDAVVISGGNIDGNVNVGVDFDGTSKENFILKTDNSLKVEASLTGGVKFLLGGKVYEKSDVSGEASGDAQSSANIDANATVNHDDATSTKNSGGSVDVKVNGGINLGH